MNQVPGGVATDQWRHVDIVLQDRPLSRGSTISIKLGEIILLADTPLHGLHLPAEVPTTWSAAPSHI